MKYKGKIKINVSNFGNSKNRTVSDQLILIALTKDYQRKDIVMVIEKPMPLS